MKQRHSYTNLMYHVVMRTKQREDFIQGNTEEELLFSHMKKKAHDLDAWIEEFGGWVDHIHILLRIRPTSSLSTVYGQLKGFSAWSWKERWPDRPFSWADGVYAVTVDPYNCQDLRNYIRNQRDHHTKKLLISRWETEEFRIG